MDKGGQGEIFYAVDIVNGKKSICKMAKEHQVLITREANIYAYLNSKYTQRKKRFWPEIKWYGDFLHDGVLKKAIIMGLLGPSLRFMKKTHYKFSLKTIMQLALQLLTCLQRLHEIGVVHRDIKPGNIVMGTGESCWRAYLIDFGTSRKFINTDGTHIPLESGKRSGTVKYASLHTHKLLASSRRDDLESLSYTLIYLYQGTLPWDTEKDWDKVKKLKEVNFLVWDKNLPEVLFKILKYSRELGFDQKPDYSYLRSLCRNCLEANSWQIDFKYEWTKNKTGNFTNSSFKKNQ